MELLFVNLEERIDDLGSVVNQGVSAPIRTPEVEYAPLFRVKVVENNYSTKVLTTSIICS